jgi:hypothetical protein
MINPSQGRARVRLGQEVLDLLSGGSLVVDDRRRRSLFFDGRFLTARDFTREQSYFLGREGDLGGAGGAGVFAGLGVSLPDPKAPTRIKIGAGSGLTPTGELCTVPADVTLDIADVPEIERLDVAFGLSPIPRASARSRSGLFVLALRPVEFTANPVASYPTSVGGARTVEDGDIVEAAAVTLIPYPNQSSSPELDQRRAVVAREIFAGGGARGLPSDALPLAMVALDHGSVRWIDLFLVRREIGAEPLDVLGFGYARRALREAYLLQYYQHLADVLRQRELNLLGRKFAASEHFSALPPTGRLPQAAIDPADFSQVFFPPAIDVSLALIAEDELSPLVDESLMLPPIDLAASSDDLSSTAVLVLIPLPRDVLRRTMLSVQAQGSLTQVLPGVTSTPLPAGQAPDPAWQHALAGVDPLYYVRRRNLPYKADLVGKGVTSIVAPVNPLPALTSRLTLLGPPPQNPILTELLALQDDPNAPGPLAEAFLMLSAPALGPLTLLAAASHELFFNSTGGVLNHGLVVTVAERYTDPTFGAGIARLESGFFYTTPTTLTSAALVQAVAEAAVITIAPPAIAPQTVSALVYLDRIAAAASASTLHQIFTALSQLLAQYSPLTGQNVADYVETLQ